VIFTAGCAQLAPKIGQIEQNVDEASEAIRQLGHAGADLVVLPELASSGYVFESKDEARALAQPADGPALGRVGARRAGRGNGGGRGVRRARRRRECLQLGAVSTATASSRLPQDALWDREKLVFTPGPSNLRWSTPGSAASGS